MIKLKKVFCLLSAFALAISLCSCGSESQDPELPETPLDLADCAGWWVASDAFEEAETLCPLYAYICLDADEGTGIGYDEYGTEMGGFACTVEDSVLRMESDESIERVFLGEDGSALYTASYGVESYVRLEGEPEFADREDQGDISWVSNLDGKWYFNHDRSQWIEFAEDGTYCIRNAEGETLEKDTYSFNYLDMEKQYLHYIDLNGSFNMLYPVPYCRAFYEDTMGKVNAYISEEEMDTEEADRVMQAVRVMNLRFNTVEEQLEYPTFWVLRFSVGSFFVERIEKRPDTNYIIQEMTSSWDVDKDGLLELTFDDGSMETFNLDDIEESVTLETLNKTFLRNHDYPYEDSDF